MTTITTLVHGAGPLFEQKQTRFGDTGGLDLHRHDHLTVSARSGTF